MLQNGPNALLLSYNRRSENIHELRIMLPHLLHLLRRLLEALFLQFDLLLVALGLGSMVSVNSADVLSKLNMALFFFVRGES